MEQVRKKHELKTEGLKGEKNKQNAKELLLSWVIFLASVSQFKRKIQMEEKWSHGDSSGSDKSNLNQGRKDY